MPAERRQLQDKYVLRLPDGMRERLKLAAGTTHRSMNAEIVARLAASFTQKLEAELPPNSQGDEVSDANLVALRAIGGRTAADDGCAVIGGPACFVKHPTVANFDVDRLDRLTTIVDRTRLALGTTAARQLWPMLGLPALRTSSRRTRSNGDVPDLFSGFGAHGASPDLRISPAIEPFEAKVPREYVSAFMRERCRQDSRDELPAQAFRDAYVEWAGARGAPVMPQAVLGKFAVSLGLRPRKTKGRTVYVGCRLHDEVRRGAVDRGV